MANVKYLLRRCEIFAFVECEDEKPDCQVKTAGGFDLQLPVNS